MLTEQCTHSILSVNLLLLLVEAGNIWAKNLTVAFKIQEKSSY